LKNKFIFVKYYFFGSGKPGMNLYVHTRTMKIVLYTKHPHLRAHTMQHNTMTREAMGGYPDSCYWEWY